MPLIDRGPLLTGKETNLAEMRRQELEKMRDRERQAQVAAKATPQPQAQASGGVGKTLGATAGTSLGTSLGGPVGGAIGGALGGALGDTISGAIFGDDKKETTQTTPAPQIASTTPGEPEPEPATLQIDDAAMNAAIRRYIDENKDPFDLNQPRLVEDVGAGGLVERY